MNIQLINKFRKKLKKGAVISSWSQIADPNLLEIITHERFDCATLDFEHGIFSIENLPNLLRVLEISKKLSLVRLPNKNLEICRQVLDTGSDGIIIPNITNDIELKRIIDISILPPKGKRGVGFSRTNNFGKKFKKYLKSKTQPVIIAMIENLKAIKNLKKILSVKNLDAILIGPYDLSASMGIPGNLKNKRFKENLKFIKTNCKKFGIPCGLHLIEPSFNKLKICKKQGYRFIPYSVDTVIISKAIKELFNNK